MIISTEETFIILKVLDTNGEYCPTNHPEFRPIISCVNCPVNFMGLNNKNYRACSTESSLIRAKQRLQDISLEEVINYYL